MEEEEVNVILDDHVAEEPELFTEFKLKYHSYTLSKTKDLPIQIKKKSDQQFQLGLIPLWLKTQFLSKQPTREKKPGKFMVLTESSTTHDRLLDTNMPQAKEEKYIHKLLCLIIILLTILDLLVLLYILFLIPKKILDIVTSVIILPLQLVAIYGMVKKNPNLLLVYVIIAPLLVPIQILNSNSFFSVCRSFVWILQFLVVYQLLKRILPRIIKSQ
ncbi:hypothetical protein M0813_06038 [Anaeramoeba flamelloides]|uniref:Uncharacterized protein n=1 Tax=Anaeramoeba flamelloides TaxID=1746091 RepID=A0AAV7YH26_9EUKA|nr:hypothetical protein M0812_25872 [Anaeramoeba flamelloides]KAJ6231309.1 hypothetical protein M0813_06038 [Anaeramoeba flamelloides]